MSIKTEKLIRNGLMEYLVVDGYNIINAWKDIFDLDKESLECRKSSLIYCQITKVTEN